MRFFGLDPIHLYPYEKYTMMCTRSWWECFKLGMRHVWKGNAIFFTISKRRPKKSSHSH